MNKLTIALAGMIAGVLATQGSAVDFVKEVKPIFANTCYKCHGPEKHKGDLRLDQKKAILEAEKVIVPGKPEESELYKRITLPADHDDVMPPADKGKPLTKDQQELIKKWIAEGANFGDWTADAGSPTAAGDKHEPTEEKLPQVPAASEDALARLREAGALAMPLAANTNLLNVDFRAEAANTGDAQLALLRPVQEQIAWLGLGKTKVTDAGLDQIKGLKNLRKLHLENTGITDAGLVHLKGLAELQYLNIYGAKVTDAGLENLKGLKNLKKLYVWQTQVTDAGAKALKAALPGVDVNRGWEPPPTPPAPPAAAAAAPAAPAPNPDQAKFAALAAGFKPDSCCDKANKEKKVCEHPCCKEALAANKVCQKCNAK